VGDRPETGGVRSLLYLREREQAGQQRTVQTLRQTGFDILPGLQGEDSHARTALRWVGSFGFVEGAVRVGTRAHRGAVSTGHVTWPVLLSSDRRIPSFPLGFRRSSADSEVPVSLPVPTYSDGVSSRFGRMHPNLSDCPGMGADGPRRMGTEPFRWPLNLPNRALGNDDGDSSPPSRAEFPRLQSRN
jgi:hypothetical protein